MCILADHVVFVHFEMRIVKYEFTQATGSNTDVSCYIT